MDAWLFDLYPRGSVMVLWFFRPDGSMIRLEDPFTPVIYLDGAEPHLSRAIAALERSGDCTPLGWTNERRDFWTKQPQRVFSLRLNQVAGWHDRLKQHARANPRVAWFNADLLAEQIYCYERGVFPLARCRIEPGMDGRLASLAVLDDPWAKEYEAPPLTMATLSAEGSLHGGPPKLRRLSLECDGRAEVWDEPGAMLEGFQSALDRLDPDVLITDGGDGFLFPLLLITAQMAKFPLRLDREPPPQPREIKTEGHSFISYGRILFKQPDYPLYGRWHLDSSSSFMMSKTGLHGLYETARLSGVPVQRIGRRSIGTGITSVQLRRAYEENTLVPWKKTRPEAWKTANQLLLTDRGGLVYAPLTGMHEDIVELDFASMYPTIMDRYNVSPETVNCRCCENEAVPDIGYTICEKVRGLVSEALHPIIEKRQGYKALRRAAQESEDDAAYAKFHGRQDSLKWMLVCCFGYLGYRNARFGRIEAHEAVSAYSRELLTRAREVCLEAGWEMLHANVDCVWIRKPGYRREEIGELIAAIDRATGLDIALEGIYKWIAFLPSRQVTDRPVPTRYFGAFREGGLKYRGIECRRSDYPAYVQRVQLELLEKLAEAQDAAAYRAMMPVLRKEIAAAEDALWRMEVPTDELVMQTVLSREPEEYKGNHPSAIAARQAVRAKLEMHAGQKIRYLFTSMGDADADRRVRLTALMDPDTTYDPAMYVKLLRRAMNTLLWPADEQLNEKEIFAPWAPPPKRKKNRQSEEQSRQCTLFE